MTKERRRKDENESLRYEKGCRLTKDEKTKTKKRKRIASLRKRLTLYERRNRK